MKIDPFDRNSPYGVYLQNVGYVHSPFLRDIAKIGYTQYQYAAMLFLYTPEKYFTDVAALSKSQSIWNNLSNDQQANLSMFDIYTNSDDGRDELKSSLSLFVSGELTWDAKRNAFLVNMQSDDNGKIYVDGIIDKESYPTVAKLCLDYMGVKPDEALVENPKFRNEKDRLFYERFMQKKKEHKTTHAADPDFELSNMISVICTYHNSLNYSNIYDLTVAQVHDTFRQLLRAKQIQIKETNYSVWGGKNYDPREWFQVIK